MNPHHGATPPWMAPQPQTIMFSPWHGAVPAAGPTATAASLPGLAAVPGVMPHAVGVGPGHAVSPYHMQMGAAVPAAPVGAALGFMTAASQPAAMWTGGVPWPATVPGVVLSGAYL